MNTSQFSLANRKQLADVLSDKYEGLRYKAKQKFDQKAKTLRRSIIEEFAEKRGAQAVVRQIEAGQKKLRELSVELENLGFDLTYGDLRLHDQRSNPLDDIIDKRVEKEIGSNADIDARFDSAQLAMMTVASLEDADKLLKSVSSI
jgi:hypothetical protein